MVVAGRFEVVENLGKAALRLFENSFCIETYKSEHLFPPKIACGAALPDSLRSSTALRGG